MTVLVALSLSECHRVTLPPKEGPTQHRAQMSPWQGVVVMETKPESAREDRGAALGSAPEQELGHRS